VPKPRANVGAPSGKMSPTEIAIQMTENLAEQMEQRAKLREEQKKRHAAALATPGRTALFSSGAMPCSDPSDTTPRTSQAFTPSPLTRRFAHKAWAPGTQGSFSHSLSRGHSSRPGTIEERQMPGEDLAPGGLFDAPFIAQPYLFHQRPANRPPTLPAPYGSMPARSSDSHQISQPMLYRGAERLQHATHLNRYPAQIACPRTNPQQRPAEHPYDDILHGTFSPLEPGLWRLDS
jgi:hypothetical protein